MEKIAWSLSEDGRTSTISLPGAPGYSLTLSTTDVERLIGSLVGLRTRMLPPVPLTLPVNQTYRGILDPSMSGEIDGLGENILIHFRHPGAGWVHFGFSPARGRTLGKYLLEQADLVDATRAKVPARKN